MRDTLEVAALSVLMFIGGWLWAASGIAQDIDSGKQVRILGKDYVCTLQVYLPALPNPPIIAPED